MISMKYVNRYPSNNGNHFFGAESRYREFFFSIQVCDLVEVPTDIINKDLKTSTFHTQLISAVVVCLN